MCQQQILKTSGTQSTSPRDYQLLRTRFYWLTEAQKRDQRTNRQKLCAHERYLNDNRSKDKGNQSKRKMPPPLKLDLSRKSRMYTRTHTTRALSIRQGVEVTRRRRRFDISVNPSGLMRVRGPGEYRNRGIRPKAV